MPSITYDAQSFSIDARRRWLVAGTLDYARIPRQQWGRRIAAARQAGLNCIGVALNWSLHETAPGRFDFKGDLDVASFIRAIGQAGMLCILRPGPFVDSGWDLGALPAWLLKIPGAPLRSPAPAFLEACSRWIAAVMDQVRDLQATNARSSGPIALIQVEHEWFCGDDQAGTGYLGELGRFFRENGATVPLINCNNLYLPVEGEIDAWTGSGAMHAIMRQLRHVRPDAPRLVADFRLGRADVWGRDPAPHAGPVQAIHHLAQILAGGAQFQISPFHAGTTFGFGGGRIAGPAGGYSTTCHDSAAPLGEAGARAAMYAGVKRICTFASSFERLFAGLEAEYQPVAIDPSSHRAASVVHCRGSMGSVAFVFASEGASGKGAEAPATTARLTLSDGFTLNVDLSAQPAVWCLLDTLLISRSTLDYANLSAFALVGRVLVVYAPAGSHAEMSINGSHFEAVVPSGEEPLIEEHEGVAVVICNHEQIDAAYATEEGVFIGCAGLDDAGAPIPHASFRTCIRIDRSGAVTRSRTEAPTRAPRSIPLTNWSCAGADEYVEGSSDRFATIDGPESLEQLGVPHGYAWLRIRIPSASARKARAGFFASGDRLHLYLDSKLHDVLGDGPLSASAADTDADEAHARITTLPLKKGQNTLTILVDNLGRWSSGLSLGEPKGLYAHGWEVAPIKAGKATIVTETPIEPLQFRSPLWGVHDGDRTDARRASWTIAHRKKTPIFMTLRPSAGAASASLTNIAGQESGAFRALIALNSKPVHAMDDSAGVERITFAADQLSRGNNVIQIAPLPRAGPAESADAALKALASSVAFYEGVACLTEKAEWAFAKWTIPSASAFHPVPAGGRAAGRPTWWKCQFKAGPRALPLFLDAAGLTKGQIYLNGRNLCRYFVAMRDGKKTPPQERYYLPEAWLKEDAANDLLIFDEHGASPTKCRLVYEAEGSGGR